jgi:UDP-N-acetylmuramoyl-tripeptide--D-alanyl-D-alanine ligase
VVDELVTVGQRAILIADAAWRAGLHQSVITELADPLEAIDFLKDRLKPGEVVLIKGSHGLRMERITAALETSS